MRILFVEDEALVRDVVGQLLRDFGFEVLEAASGGEALTILDTTPVDVLFTDIRMPGEPDGWTLAERARATIPDLGVIYASGFSPVPHRLVAGSRFLHKPYFAAQVVTAIDGLCADRPPRS